MHRLLVLSAAASLLAAGCNMPGPRLNAPPHGRACETSDLQGTFTYMGDNALLADMTVNDSHFLPHRASLNDLGTQRLSRLASLMEAYAGTVRFDTELTETLLENLLLLEKAQRLRPRMGKIGPVASPTRNLRM